MVETHQKAVGEAYDAAKLGDFDLPDEKYGLSTMNIAGLTEGVPDRSEKSDSAVASGDLAMDVEDSGGISKEENEASGKDWDRLKKMTDKDITKKDLQVAASVALASAAVKAKVRFDLWFY